MTKPTIFRFALAASLLAVPLLVVSNANPRRKPVRLASLPKLPTPVAPTSQAKLTGAAKIRAAAKLEADLAKLPQYISMAQAKRIQTRRMQVGDTALPVLQPSVGGKALRVPMHNLLGAPAFDSPAKAKKILTSQERTLFAQAFPRPVPPAGIRSRSAVRANVVPKWVRYPLEFQLCGIGLGTRAVDKDRFNRIDRYGLFALHGNPTAVVRSVGGASSGAAPTGGADAGGGGPVSAGGALGAPGAGALAGAPGGLAGGGGAAPTAGAGGSNVTMQQTPPELAGLFPNSQQGGTPDWALAITVQLDNNHVEWLYKRETYAMGFVVDRLGFVDAVIVAGIQSDIARTQLEDPVHTVKLGDDLRKVLFRYGYPDDLVPLGSESVASASPGTGAIGGAPTGPEGGAAPGGALGAPGGGLVAPGGADAAGGAGAAAGGGGTTNSAFRTFDLRYEQSYNVVFSIRNNRVIRIYIFGDPDFFNNQRRNLLRTKY